VEDTKFEVFIVSIAAGLALEHADFAVHYFQFSGVDGMFVPIQDKRVPHVEFSCSIYQDSDLILLRRKIIEIFMKHKLIAVSNLDPGKIVMINFSNRFDCAV